MNIKVLIKCLFLQYDSKRYEEYVRKTDYKKALLDEPVTLRDKDFNNREFSETSISNITSHFHLHKQIAEKYHLNRIADGKSDFEKTVQLLRWLTDHTFYNGSKLNVIADNTLDILDYSFDKPFKNAINCRWKAIALADCLVAAGIKAYPVCMESLKFEHCHFTCHAYISELGKWCVFDPSFGCWFSRNDGTPIDIFEMREMFLQGLEPVVHGYNFNGTEECFDVYMNAFLKNCISNLSTWHDNSMDRRTSGKISKRKRFVGKIPRDL